MSISTITIAGGDLRQCYAAKYLAESGFAVTCFHTLDFPYNLDIHQENHLATALAHAQVILIPTPVSMDNIHLTQKNPKFPPTLFQTFAEALPLKGIVTGTGLSDSFTSVLSKRQISFCSLSNDSVFIRANSALTGEGLLAEIIRNTPFSFRQSTVVLLGCGNCGKAVTNIMSPLCKKFYIFEQNPKEETDFYANTTTWISPNELIHILPHCEIIINTIPQQILTRKQLLLLPENCHIFDIASAPFGFSSDITAQYLLPYFRLPGIPGRFSPQTAGTIIGSAIERMIAHEL
ncbi:MAG: dipicolinate synthase subunit DpsA [Lachnospiraceae bacterium]